MNIGDNEKIREYIDTICGEINWKKARAAVSEELMDHISDLMDHYLHDGMEGTEAVKRAIAQMGDPHVIGRQLNEVHRPKSQRILALSVSALLLLGLMIRLTMFLQPKSHSNLPTDLCLLLVGVGLFALSYFGDFAWIGRHPKTFCCTVTGAALITMVFSRIPIYNALYYYGRYAALLLPPAYCAMIYSMRDRG